MYYYNTLNIELT